MINGICNKHYIERCDIITWLKGARVWFCDALVSLPKDLSVSDNRDIQYNREGYMALALVKYEVLAWHCRVVLAKCGLPGRQGVSHGLTATVVLCIPLKDFIVNLAYLPWK